MKVSTKASESEDYIKIIDTFHGHSLCLNLTARTGCEAVHVALCIKFDKVCRSPLRLGSIEHTAALFTI